ncbi:hypothetical protein FBQ95_17025 [Chloroflexi bacterium CFX3]|nr:hypothetical protein [Chloroflexi bacterium CFX3]
MHLINFNKPLGAQSIAAIVQEVGESLEVTEVNVADFRPLPTQVYGLVAELGLDPRETYILLLPDSALFTALLVAAFRNITGHSPWVFDQQSGEIYALSALYLSRAEISNS